MTAGATDRYISPDKWNIMNYNAHKHTTTLYIDMV